MCKWSGIISRAYKDRLIAYISIPNVEFCLTKLRSFTYIYVHCTFDVTPIDETL
jgi:hypothetical protein